MPLKIQIQLDYRERALLDVLRPLITSAGGKADIELVVPANLQVGDIIISVIGDLGQTLRQLYIERKSYADLIASIKDGRYKEQKLRLQSMCAQNIWPSRFIYLIESGTQPDESTGSLFYGSWVSMALRDNIPVIRVLSMAEGARFICRLAERLVKDANELIPTASPSPATNSAILGQPTAATDSNSNSNSNIRQIILTPRCTTQQAIVSVSLVDGDGQTIPNSGEGEASEAVLGSGSNTISGTGDEYTRAVIGGIKTKKGDNMTRELCHKTMLSIIPGISAGLCEQILVGYGGSLSRLIRSLELVEGGTETKETRIAQLAATEIKTSTGKTRKLGPVLAQRLWDYLASN